MAFHLCRTSKGIIYGAKLLHRSWRRHLPLRSGGVRLAFPSAIRCSAFRERRRALGGHRSADAHSARLSYELDSFRVRDEPLIQGGKLAGLSVPIELRRLRVHEDKLVEREQGEANIVILEVQPVQPAAEPTFFQSVESARSTAPEANRATAV